MIGVRVLDRRGGPSNLSSRYLPECECPLPRVHDVPNEREARLSREREAWRLPASAEAVTTTRKRGIAISKTTATRNRTRITSLPSPTPTARCPDTEN